MLLTATIKAFFEIVNPFSILLQVLYLSERGCLLYSSENRHTHCFKLQQQQRFSPASFLSDKACFSKFQVMWGQHVLITLGPHGFISIKSYIHRHQLVLLFKSQYVLLLHAVLALAMKTVTSRNLTLPNDEQMTATFCNYCFHLSCVC